MTDDQQKEPTDDNPFAVHGETGAVSAHVRPPLSTSLATREMMRLRQELAATLLELSQDAIIIRDADDQVTFWNRGAHEMYGFGTDEACRGLSTSSWARRRAPGPN